MTTYAEAVAHLTATRAEARQLAAQLATAYRTHDALEARFTILPDPDGDPDGNWACYLAA